MPVVIARPEPLGWELASASYDTKFADVSGQINNQPGGVYFSSDGLKMYVAGQDFSNGAVYEYDLTVAWDVSTAGSPAFFSVDTQTSSPAGLHFKPDGKEMYVVDQSGDRLYQYTLSTGWDISTASYGGKFIAILTTASAPSGVQLSIDGTKVFYTLIDGNIITMGLSVAWDISTATDGSSTFVSGSTPQDLFFKSNGKRMFVVQQSTNKVVQYDLGTAWDISTSVDNGVFFFFSGETPAARGIAFKDDGKKMYLSSSDTIEKVFQYSTVQ